MRTHLGALALLLAACGGVANPAAPLDPMSGGGSGGGSAGGSGGGSAGGSGGGSAGGSGGGSAGGSGGGAANPTAPLDPMRVPLGASPQRGPADAWVTIVEFADFECPYSAEQEPGLEQVLADLPDDVRLVYKQFPLYPLHPDSRIAAVAAECARVQGPAPDGFFWPLHDVLLKNHDNLSAVALPSYAAQISGLDSAAWSDCIAMQAPLDRILTDQAQSELFGVRHTPTFAINGKPVVGAYADDSFRALVNRAMSKAKASGIPRGMYYQQAILGQ